MSTFTLEYFTGGSFGEISIDGVAHIGRNNQKALLSLLRSRERVLRKDLAKVDRYITVLEMDKRIGELRAEMKGLRILINEVRSLMNDYSEDKPWLPIFRPYDQYMTPGEGVAIYHSSESGGKGYWSLAVYVKFMKQEDCLCLKEFSEYSFLEGGVDYISTSESGILSWKEFEYLSRLVARLKLSDDHVLNSETGEECEDAQFISWWISGVDKFKQEEILNALRDPVITWPIKLG